MIKAHEGSTLTAQGEADQALAVSERPALVILPTFNERENIVTMISRLLESSGRTEILVIDDGSPDGTSSIVRELMHDRPRVHLIERKGKLGLGSAYLLGFEYALHGGFGAAITMDADHSHDPVHIDAMLSLAENGADLVIGSRYTEGGSVENWGAIRRLNSGVANLLARRVVGQHVRDCTSGYRLYSAPLLERMRRIGLRSTGYSMLVELLYEATVSAASIAEVPIRFRDRVAGESKISWQEVAESLRTLLRLKALQIAAKQRTKLMKPAQKASFYDR